MSGSNRTVAALALHSIAVFREISLEECAAIAERCGGRQYANGEEIISYRDQTNDVYFIVSGDVRATIFTYSGKKVSFRDIGAGNVFGEWAAIDGEPRSSSVVALSEAFVASMSADAFKVVVTSHPNIAWILMQELTRLARQLSGRIVEFSALGVAGRLHAELLRLAEQNVQADGSGVITPFPTNEELASRISTRREAVNRELRRLEKLKLLERDTNKRIIRDLEGFRELVSDAEGD